MSVVRSKIARADREYIFERDGHKCLKCQATSNLTIDHVTSLVHGGQNHVTNYQTLCKKCNGEKGSSSLDYRWNDSPEVDIDAGYLEFLNRRNGLPIPPRRKKKEKLRPDPEYARIDILPKTVFNDTYVGNSVSYKYVLPHFAIPVDTCFCRDRMGYLE